jgi:hypothetical protein
MELLLLQDIKREDGSGWIGKDVEGSVSLIFTTTNNYGEESKIKDLEWTTAELAPKYYFASSALKTDATLVVETGIDHSVPKKKAFVSSFLKTEEETSTETLLGMS